MAIEIAPVKKETTLNQNLVLIGASLVFVISLGAFFYLNNVYAQKQLQSTQLKQDLATLAGSDVKAKEEELALAGKYINDFKILYESNPKVSGFFTSFSKWTHSKVTYSGFSLDVPTRKVTMTGTTSGFQNIMQQIAILKSEATIESYEISNVSLSEDGSVSFNLDVVLKPEVFK
jgi:hypothetical protein